MLPIHALLASALAVGIAAQTQTAPAKPLVTTPHVLVETVGPDGWRARLGPTNIGGMLASKEGRSYWEPGMTPLFGVWQMMVGDEAAFAVARDRVLGFSGSVQLAMHFEDGDSGDRPSHLALLLQGDGRTDMVALGAELRELMQRGLPGEWRQGEVTAKAQELRVHGSDVMSAPIVDGERLLIVATTDADLATGLALARHLQGRELAIGKPMPGSPALRVTVDMHGLMAASGMFTDTDAPMMKALGFDSLGDLDITVSAAGPHLALDMAVGFRDGDRGIFGALMPTSLGVSSLAQLVPDKTAAWKVGRFDFAAMFEAIVSAVEKAPFWQDEPGKVRQEMKDEFGIDVGADLLLHMTDEMLVIGSPFQDFGRAAEATWLFAFRLADEARFAPGMEAMLKQVKPWLSSAETIAVGDVQLRRYSNMFSYDVWMATGNGLFVIAGGRDGEETATAILTQAAAGELPPVAGTEPWFAGLDRHLPPGLNGVARFDLDAIVGIPVEWWFEIAEDFLWLLPPGTEIDPDTAEESQERFRRLLHEHNLTAMRTATGHAGARWHWRLFW